MKLLTTMAQTAGWLNRARQEGARLAGVRPWGLPDARGMMACLLATTRLMMIQACMPMHDVLRSWDLLACPVGSTLQGDCSQGRIEAGTGG